MKPMNIAFFGSSLVSAYWNGAATYYRGIIHALSQRGHRITFFEPDAFARQSHRDISDPDWANVVVYESNTSDGVFRCLEQAASADIVIKASGVGVFDELLESAVLQLQDSRTIVAFWDVDAPATLERLSKDPGDSFHPWIPKYDLVLTYGGGPPVVEAYRRLGARDCVPIYNALDPSTHHPVPRDHQFQADLAFLGNRLPDRETRVHEFFFQTAQVMPAKHFLLGGSGWDENVPQLPNLKQLGHVYTHQHNAFNCSPLAILNISRQSMAELGYSPATRLFEAAGAGACIITDSWEGIDRFLVPAEEVLVAENTADVVRLLSNLDEKKARQIGDRARSSVLRHHTYRHRALDFERALNALGPLNTQPISESATSESATSESISSESRRLP